SILLGVKRAMTNPGQAAPRIEVPIKDKYLLTIREAGAYFGLGTKYMRRIAEQNEGGFAIFIGNKYMIIRRKFEEYMDEMAIKNTVE
ncbi:MAG: excisionase, partial [Eubacterium sp.]